MQATRADTGQTWDDALKQAREGYDNVRSSSWLAGYLPKPQPEPRLGWLRHAFHRWWSTKDQGQQTWDDAKQQAQRCASGGFLCRGTFGVFRP